MSGAPTVTDSDFDALDTAANPGSVDQPTASDALDPAFGGSLASSDATERPDCERAGRWMAPVSALAFVVAIVLANGALFIRAQGSAARAADVVVVLNGGDGERLETGLGIVDRGTAPELVISHGVGGEWVPAERVCNLDRSIEVQCPSPELLTTRGEAEMVADLAEANGWERIDVVTSSYHGPRARILFSRCITDAEIHVVTVRPRIGLGSWAKRIVHEWGGIVQMMGESTCER